ncbi:MAG: hypothetical protein R3Y59_00135 [bacterium]
MIRTTIITSLLFFVSLLSAQELEQTLWQQATEQYSSQQYTEAANTYEQILQSGKSAALYYNYANSLFKSGEIGAAILNYERALLLAPSDEDIKFNLEFANQQKSDKIDKVDKFFLFSWTNALMHRFTPNQWAYMAITLFSLTLALLLIYFFSKRRAIRKLAFYLAISLLFLTIVSFLYSFASKSEMVKRAPAIVMVGSVSVNSAPDVSGTEVFVLHEGTKVYIKSQLTDWSEISIESGNIGWIPTSAIEPI